MNNSIARILKEIVNEESYDEALEILSLASPSRVNQFRNYYNKSEYSTCCMLLDTIKMDLVHYKFLKQNKNDKFGEPIWKL